MGLPALNGRGAWRWRPNPRVLPSAVWPLILAWRVLLFAAGAVWRAPELILLGVTPAAAIRPLRPRRRPRYRYR